MEEKLLKFEKFNLGAIVKIIPGTRFYTGGPNDGNPKDMKGEVYHIDGAWIRVRWANGRENGYEKRDIELVGVNKDEIIYYDANKIYLTKEPKDLADIFNILYPKDKNFRSQNTYNKAKNAEGTLLLQCAEGKMRSFDDLWIIADTYFPGIDPTDVFKEMLTFNVTLKDVEEGVLPKSLSNCSTMERIRFTPSRSTIKAMWYSVDCNKYKSVYTWRDLFNMIYVNSFEQLENWYKTEIAEREALARKKSLPVNPKVKKAVKIEKNDVIPLKYRSQQIV